MGSSGKLYRGVAGITAISLIFNLPKEIKTVKECIKHLSPAIIDALKAINQ